MKHRIVTSYVPTEGQTDLNSETAIQIMVYKMSCFKIFHFQSGLKFSPGIYLNANSPICAVVCITKMVVCNL